MTEQASSLDLLLERISTAADPKIIAGLAEQAIQLMRREQNPALWASLHGLLGSALIQSVSGRFDADLLGRARAAYEAALSVFDSERDAEIWLTTQRNLADTHAIPVRYGIGDARTHAEAAFAAYEKAIETRPARAGSPDVVAVPDGTRGRATLRG